MGGMIGGATDLLKKASPWGAAFDFGSQLLGRSKADKAAKQEQKAAQAVADQNWQAQTNFLNDPATRAAVLGGDTSTQSGSESSNMWQDTSGEQRQSVDFGARAGEAAAALADAAAGVNRANTLAGDEIKAGAQSLSADTAMRRGALQAAAARRGVSAADMALGDPMLAAGNRAQSALVAAAKEKALAAGEQARGTYRDVLDRWYGSRVATNKQKTRGGSSSSYSGTSNTKRGSDILNLGPVAKTYVPKNQPQ